jgi:NADPH-dependent 2,4-dienoyl-CoA reductase/sulfur reductase-like enzyme
LLGVLGKAREATSYLSSFVKYRIPYSVGHAITAIHGNERVESVTVTALNAIGSPVVGTGRTIEVDAVCLGHGFTPRLELPIAAGCRLSSQRFVVVDENQATSTPGVFAAGEITGVGGVDLALAEGAIAGHAAAGGNVGDAPMRRYRESRRRYRQFASRIEVAHAVGTEWADWLTPDTIICRCEEVSFERLCSVANASQSVGLRSLKLLTRAGLGICQGRVCGRTVEELLARRSPGGRLIDGVSTDRRPIAMPIRLGELASEFNTVQPTDKISSN